MLTRFTSAICSFLMLMLAAALPCARATDQVPRPAALTFPSGGARIRVDHFTPAAGAPLRPAVLVLHGAGGTLLDGPEMRRVAGALAAAGHPAYLVHYFNRTGTIVARDAVLRKLYAVWLPVVRDAVDFVYQREGGHAPVGLYGYSLGAFLSVGVAGDNPRVGAVVEEDGGVWNNESARLGHRMPPELMVHGREDQRVPFAQYALPLQRSLRERGTAVETRFVSGEGHIFSAGAQAGVRAATVDFFARRLPPAPGYGRKASSASIRPVRPLSIR